MLSDPRTKGIQMSQVHTLQMGRLVAAGSKNKLSEVIHSLASLEALHIVDYDDSEEGFSSVSYTHLTLPTILLV